MTGAAQKGDVGRVRRKRAKPHPYAQEIAWARAIMAQFGCEVVEADLAKYEIAKVKGDGVSLVIYPHTTSANNEHARVRDNGSKDKRRAALMMRALDHGYGLAENEAWKVRQTCTFSQKNYSSLWDDTEKLNAVVAASQTGGGQP